MLGRLLKSHSRQALGDAGRRGSRCTCRAKRYVPSSRQRKASASGGPSRVGSGGRKPSAEAPQPADPDELLRELNNGGAGWLRDEEEQDWGLDDVAAHARARQQQQFERFGDSLPGAARANTGGGGGGGIGGGSARRRGGGGGRRGSDVAAAETHGSPLEAGLASIVTTEAVATRSGSSFSSGKSDGGGGVIIARGVDGVAPAAAAPTPASTRWGTTVELEMSYARRNPEVVEALRVRGVAVRVRQTADEAGDDGEYDSEHPSGRYLDADPGLDELDSSDEHDDLNLALDSDLTTAEDRRTAAAGASSGGGGSGKGKEERGGSGTPAASRDWYGSLAAAGFSVRTNAAGEIFLERTIRRKAGSSASAAAAPAGAAAAILPAATLAAASLPPAAAAAAPPPPLVAPLEPISGRPAIVSALQRLAGPQQVLDFLELSYSEWAANGYRLVDMRSGRPVAAPSPAEAAHCLRALAITAHRSEIGGWRCLELAAGRQAQGLAEALRVAPPRLLPEHATPQLSAAYFDVARQFWLDPAAEPIIGDPRVGRARAAAAATAAAAAVATQATGSPDPGICAASRQTPTRHEGAAGGAAAESEAVPAALANEEFAFSVCRASTSSHDKVYDSLVAKYTAVSEHQKPASSPLEARQVSRQEDRLAVATTRPGEKIPLGAVPSEAVAPAAAAAAAAVRRAAKIECLVSALWAMSSLGGPPYFQAETEAVATILVRCLASAAAPLPKSAAVATTPSACAGGLSGWQAGQVLWALGNSRHVTPRLTDLETCILRSGGLSAMQPRDVTRVLWGFASLGHRPERLLLTIKPDWSWRELTTAVVPDPGPYSERDPGKRKGGRRRKGRRRTSPGAGGSADGGAEPRGDVGSFNLQQLASASWSLAVMEQVDTGPFRSAWSQLLRRAAEVPPAEAVLTQVWQANLAIHLESTAGINRADGAGSAGAGLNTSPPPPQGRAGKATAAEDLAAAGLAAAGLGGADVAAAAARSLLLRARDVFLVATSGLRRKVQSGYQRQMANSLTGLRLMHLLEDNSAGYSVDITLPQLRIALEADGPTHMSRTPGAAVLGATAMKRRHLQRLGWHVINVTYKEWDKLSSEAARRTYLQERINGALLSNVKLEDDADEGEPRERGSREQQDRAVGAGVVGLRTKDA